MTGDLRFYDNDRPPLVAGDYRVTVTQQVALPPPHPSPLDYVHAQDLVVSGPRFQLGADDVVSVYPPPASTADRHAALAHVVLARPTLPWEIPLDPSTVVAGAEGDPHAPDPTVAPWLAVLVLRPDEIAYPHDAATNGNLTGVRVVALRDYLTPGTGIVGPAFDPDQVARFELEHPDLQCTVVDVDGTAFNATLPRSDELPYLAHAREVDTVDQETDGATGWFGVVVGNRFPTASPTGLYVAHLVSLEGFAGYLPDRGAAPSGSVVRLLSLYAWTFRSFAQADNFDALMGALSIDVLRMPKLKATRGEPNGPRADDPALVAQALDHGYTAAPYHTRLGEPTTAWYRGPCLPVQMKRNRQPSYPAGEAALLYDPTTGMFDVSFAVAWQVGRLLALADRDFAVSLLGWLRSLGSLSQLLADRLDFFVRYDHLEQPRTIAELLAPGTVRRAMVEALARTIAPAIVGGAGRAPACAPPRDPSGLLDQRHRAPGVVGAAEMGALHGSVLPGASVVGARAGGPEAAVVNLVRARRSPPPAPWPPSGERAPGGTSAPKAQKAPALAWRPRHRRSQGLVASADGASVVLDQGPAFPESSGRWLARLCLLEGVPFDHLVPDARMLPRESIRFFFVDRNWLDALVDGALSIGAIADHEAAILGAARDHLVDGARRHAAVERSRRRQQRQAMTARSSPPFGRTAPAIAPPERDELAPVWTGFVLRSAVVSDWPGLRVSATSPGAVPRTLLRLDRPSPTVLVAIFDGIVDRVDLATPAQTLHFGAVDDAGTLVVKLRGIGGAIDVGQQIPDRSVLVPRRADAGRWVVDTRKLVDDLAGGLHQAYEPHTPPPVDPGAVGVELVAAAERQAFVQASWGKPPPPEPDGPPRAGPAPPAPILVRTLLEELRRG
jgi:hypothetical protein